MSKHDVLKVCEVAKDALVGGSGGYLRIPKGAAVQVKRMERADCYRVTFDVTAGWPLDSAKAQEYVAETIRLLATALAAPTS